MTDKFKIVYAKWRIGMIYSGDMPAIAWDALELGFDGPSIRRLAALDHPIASDIGDLFENALVEMGVPKLGQEQALNLLVGMVAQQIVSGEIDPALGAKQLFRYWKVDYQSQLFVFEEIIDLYEAEAIDLAERDRLIREEAGYVLAPETRPPGGLLAGVRGRKSLFQKIRDRATSIRKSIRPKT